MSLNHLATRFSCDWPWKTPEEMNLARLRAVELGVDRLTWEITDHPESAFSRRFVPWGDTTSPNRDSFRRCPEPPCRTGRHTAEDRYAGFEPQLASFSGTGHPRPPFCSTRGPTVWPGRRRRGARPRAGVAASDAQARYDRRHPHRFADSRKTWTLRRQVRPCIRRYRLVRKVRVGDDDQTVGCLVGRA